MPVIMFESSFPDVSIMRDDGGASLALQLLIWIELRCF